MNLEQIKRRAWLGLMRRTHGMVETSVAGIPCLADPTHVQIVKPNCRADNPYDFHGYSEVEFDLYDRRGYRAFWLEKKMTKDDIERVEIAILKDIKERKNDF